jgi:hypothetical protein
MTFGTERRNSFSDHRRLPPKVMPQPVLGGVALAFVATLCAWTVYGFADTGADQTDPASTRGDRLDVAATFGERFAHASNRGDKLAVLKSRVSPSNVSAALFDPRFFSDRPSGFANDTPQRPDSDLVALVLAPPAFSAANRTALDIPLPPTRDRTTKSVGSSRTAAVRDGGQGNQVALEAATNRPTIFQSIFEKLFGKSAPVKLAYAATDDAGLGVGRSVTAGRYDRWTAVYDISARTVYLPDGTRLEAHSGLGSWLDDPRHADEKMRGVTPPNIYDLELRESPFHGVRALRLVPQDEEKVFGRRGLLVHTYMLGPNGDSNGCVSVKNYDAFLQAYLKHEIKQLAVVTRLE